MTYVIPDPDFSKSELSARLFGEFQSKSPDPSMDWAIGGYYDRPEN